MLHQPEHQPEARPEARGSAAPSEPEARKPSAEAHANYQPEIDGLRAVAVLGVLYFHLDFGWARGGFLGVDVFFVISGFLITRLLGEELERTGTLSFSRFYVRRARRLLPALIFTLLLCLVPAYLLLAAHHLESFGGSLAAASLSLSNLFFWSEHGYFDLQASFKPLLHTWSLSVEEQYYLTWPFVCWLIWRKSSTKVVRRVLFVASLASLLGHLFVSGDVPLWLPQPKDADSATAFFLTPFRVFELGLGGLLALSRGFPGGPRALREVGAMAGLLVILGAFTLTSHESHPQALVALCSCIGAALVLAFAPGTKAGSLLVLWPLPALGRLSYSLYLLHWPLIVFVSYHLGPQLSNPHRHLLALASVLAAAGSYLLVERPFRRTHSRRGWLSDRAFVPLVVVLLALLVGFGAATFVQRGWPERQALPASEALKQQLQAPLGDFKRFNHEASSGLTGRFGQNGRPRMLVLGDSQARDLLNVLRAAEIQNQVDLAYLPVEPKCQLTLGLPEAEYESQIPKDKVAFCREERARLSAEAALREAHLVVVSMSFRLWGARALPRVVEHLQQSSSARVVVVGPKTMAEDGLKFAQQFHAHPKAAQEQLYQPAQSSIDIQRALLEGTRGPFGTERYAFLDLLSVLCPAAIRCHAFDDQGALLLFDALHLTPQGARFLARGLEQSGALKALAR